MPLEPVPFFDLKVQYAPIRAAIDRAVAAVIDDASFVLGPDVRRFEDSFAKYCNVAHCVTVHSGTAALQLAIQALDIGPGHEVIVPANSFVATAEAVHYAGARPVFVDVDPDTFNIDARLVEEHVTERTRAIIAVHLYGQPADMEAVGEVAHRYNLHVIEDACQAHGALYGGRRTGSIGDVACFSFYPGKNLGCAGDGGAVVTASESIAGRVARLRNHGGLSRYEHELLGHNFRLDSIQTAVLSVKLPYLDEWNRARRELASYYTSCLEGCKGIKTPLVAAKCESVFHLYVLRASDRARLISRFEEARIGHSIHYPKPVHLLAPFRKEGVRLPVCEAASRQIISLPLFPELTRVQQDRVIQAIVDADLPDF